MVDFITGDGPEDQSDEYGEAAIKGIFTFDESTHVPLVKVHVEQTGPGVARILRIAYLDDDGNPVAPELDRHPAWAEGEVGLDNLADRLMAALEWEGHTADRIEIVE